ncbi:MAG: hypothetical protein WCK77_21975 [Verrucomicrobiota bacterium]
MTTPIQRITRLLSEGARFKVELPGQLAIDLTPDVIAALDAVQTGDKGFEPIKESIEPATVSGVLATRVHFP